MTASVRTNIGNADAFSVNTGLRQGCSLAPTLFILYFAAVVHIYETRAVPDVQVAYNINGHLTTKTTTRKKDAAHAEHGEFADDMALYGRTQASTATKLETFAKVADGFGLVMSWKKTKTVSTTGRYDLEITDKNGAAHTVEGVDSFSFLGSTISRGGTLDDEIAYRLSRAAKTWHALKRHLWNNRQVSPRAKAAVYRVTVLASLLYSAEAWPDLTYKQARQLECFHKRCVGALTGVNIHQKKELHVSDKMLRHRIRMEAIGELVRQRQLRWAGHVARMDSTRLVKQIAFGWIHGARRQVGGRNRVDFAKGVHRALKDRDVSEVDWFRRAQSRDSWGGRVVYGIHENERETHKDKPARDAAYAARHARGTKDRPTGKLKDVGDLKGADGGWHFPACPSNFATQQGLSSHYSKLHGVDEIERQAAGGMIKCNQCDAQFRNQARLTIHVRDVHTVGVILKCDKCGRDNFKSARGLGIHKKVCCQG